MFDKWRASTQEDLEVSLEDMKNAYENLDETLKSACI